MKPVFCLSLLLICLQLKSQTGDSLPRGKFDLGFTISPDYCYRILNARPSDSWMKEIYDTLEVPRLAYTAGLNVIYPINKKLLISSGILFSDKGEKTKKYDIQSTTNYVNHYYYLSIPLRANYCLVEKKVKFYLSAGFSADFYLASQSRITITNSTEKTDIALNSNMASVNVTFTGGIGIDCPITDLWYFKLEPGYKRSITPVYNAPVKKYFYSAGLNLGFFRKF